MLATVSEVPAQTASKEIDLGDPLEPDDQAATAARVRWSLAVGFVLVAIALVLTLSQSPPNLIWSNYAPLNGSILTTERGHASACQAPLPLPTGASAVRLSLYDADGPRVAVRVLSGGRVLTTGTRGAGWIGEPVTIPLRPVRHDVTDARLCFALGQPAGTVSLQGSATSGREALAFEGANGANVRMRVEYIDSNGSSWWSRAVSVARRMGLGRWPSGTWLALLVFAMIVAIAAGASWLTVREMG